LFFLCPAKDSYVVCRFVFRMLYMIEILTTMYNCFFFVLPKTVMLCATATVCERQAACFKTNSRQRQEIFLFFRLSIPSLNHRETSSCVFFLKLLCRVHLAKLIHMCRAVTFTHLNVQKDSFTAAAMEQRR
jgi:hypothetical protein